MIDFWKKIPILVSFYLGPTLFARAKLLFAGTKRWFGGNKLWFAGSKQAKRLFLANRFWGGVVRKWAFLLIGWIEVEKERDNLSCSY